MPRFKSIIFFYQISPKIKLFLQKNANFRALEAPPPDPVPPAARSFAPRPPASSGWGLRPQTPISLRWLEAPPPDPQTQPPIANFWLRAWLLHHKSLYHEY